MAFVQGVLWVLLVISVLLLIAVILLQEGKGGGLAEAFGGVGAETFGVKAAGINKFTSFVGAIFLALCIALTLIKVTPPSTPLVKDGANFPSMPGVPTGAPRVAPNAGAQVPVAPPNGAPAGGDHGTTDPNGGGGHPPK